MPGLGHTGLSRRTGESLHPEPSMTAARAFALVRTPGLTGMRAVQITRFGGPEVMDIVDVPDPVPGDGQQLYEVSSSGVYFADTHHLLS